ncbi:MAG TPA: SH3 domain-containing protein [Thermomicrobiales bacterium]
MPERKCGNCKHFQPAPMWKRGWCRNALLFSQNQSHLVGEDDLDCNRGMGSYWEPIGNEPSDTATAAPYMKPGDNDSLVRFSKPPQRTIAPAGGAAARRPPDSREAGRSPEPIRVRRDGVETVARPSSRAATEPIVPPRGAPSGNYGAPQEPYSWGEYLRRSYPVIGIILLLGAFWVWSARQLSTAPSPSPTAILVAPAAAPVGVNVITPTATAAAPGPAASTQPVAPPGVIAPGARVIVQTPGGAGANIRANPTTAGVLVTAQDDGTPLTITGPSQDADGYTWWPVQGDGFAGWIAGSLIALP